MQNTISSKHKIIYVLSFLLLVSITFLVTSCPKQPASDTSHAVSSTGESVSKIEVVTTTGMITDVTTFIGGEYANVHGMMGPGVDPHQYKAKESDMNKLYMADVVIYNGLHLEAKLAELLEKLEDSKVVVGLGSTIPESKLIYPDASEGVPDPHIWFDVKLFNRTLKSIVEGLSEADPEHADYFEEKYVMLSAELEELDMYVMEMVKQVPEDKRVLVTAHDAFNYFGEAYGFEVVGLQGISTVAEAGTSDVQSLVNLVVDRQIPALFIESSVPERNIQAVKEGCKAKGFDVIIGGELFSDAMGDAGTNAGTYQGMVMHNIDTIVSALVGNTDLETQGEEE